MLTTGFWYFLTWQSKQLTTYSTSATSSGGILQLCKVLSVSLYRFRRCCA